jgi:ABC-type uncharacterized transport system substrate-binding protein
MLLGRAGTLAASVAGLGLLTTCEMTPATHELRRVARVGFLSVGLTNVQNFDALSDGMRALGWIEGRNVSFVLRAAEGERARLPGLAAELARLPVDVIVTGSADAAQFAQRATPLVAVVIAGVAESVSLGLARSLAYPGGNVTGVERVPAQLAAKRLEVLKEILPGITRFAALWDLSSGAKLQLNETQAAAPGMGLQVQVVAVKTVDDLDASVAAATRGRAEALTLHGPLFGTEPGRTRIADLAVKARLPTMAIERQYVEAGVLVSYGENVIDIYRRAATYIDKILRGTDPAELPIEQATSFELVINVNTARSLNLTIPPGVASRVDVWIR